MAESISVTGRVRSVQHALRGVWTMLRSQHNAWLHLGATVVVAGAGLAVRLTLVEWCLIVLAVVSVWTAEALNTALEFLCDVASPDFHPLVQKSKNVAAGGVLITALGALAVGLLVFGPRILH
jgi:diacylglycerol kinase (ATP)